MFANKLCKNQKFISQFLIVSLFFFILTGGTFIGFNTADASGNNDNNTPVDLTIIDFYLDRSELETHQKGRAFITVYNDSTSDVTEDFSVSIIDRYGNVDVPLYSTRVYGLKALLFKTVTIDLIGNDFYGQGEHQYDYRQDNSDYHVYAVVDSENEVYEMKEGNNQSHFQDFGIYFFEGTKSDLQGAYRAKPVTYNENTRRQQNNDEPFKISTRDIIAHTVKVENIGTNRSILEGPINVHIQIYRVTKNNKKIPTADFTEFVDVGPLQSDQSDIYTLQYRNQYQIPGLY